MAHPQSRPLVESAPHPRKVGSRPPFRWPPRDRRRPHNAPRSTNQQESQRRGVLYIGRFKIIPPANRSRRGRSEVGGWVRGGGGGGVRPWVYWALSGGDGGGGGGGAGLGRRRGRIPVQTFKRRGRPWMPQQRDHAALSASPAPCRDRSAPVRPSARPPVRPSVRSSAVRPSVSSRGRTFKRTISPLAGPGCRSNGTTPHSPHPPPRAATAVHPSVRPLVRPSARPPARPLVRRPPVDRVLREMTSSYHQEMSVFFNLPIF